MSCQEAGARALEASYLGYRLDEGADLYLIGIAAGYRKDTVEGPACHKKAASSFINNTSNICQSQMS